MKKLPSRRLPKRVRAWIRGRLRARAWDAVPHGRKRLKWAGEQWALSEMNRLASRCGLHVLFDSHAAESGNLIEICGLWRAHRAHAASPWQWWVRNLQTWGWEGSNAQAVRKQWPALHLWPFQGMRESTQAYALLKAATDYLTAHALMRARRRFTSLGPWEGDLARRVFKKRLRVTVLQSKRAEPALRCLRRFVWQHMLDADARSMLVAIHGRSAGFDLHDVCDLMLYLPVAQAWRKYRPNALPLLRSVPPDCWCAVEEIEDWMGVDALSELVRTKLPPPLACDGSRPWNKAARSRHERLPLESSPVPVCKTRPQVCELLAAPYLMVDEAVASGRHGGRYWGLPKRLRQQVDRLPVRERACLVGVLATAPRIPLVIISPVLSFYVQRRCAQRASSGSWGHRGSKAVLAEMAAPLAEALEALAKHKWRPKQTSDWASVLPSQHPWRAPLRAQALTQSWCGAPEENSSTHRRF